MSDSIPTEQAAAQSGVVERLARDDVERKKFLTMAGRRIGAGAAATGLAAFIAACGSSSSSSSSAAGGSSSSAAAAGTGSTSSSSSTSGSGDLAIVNYALTLEYLEAQFYAEVGKSGLFKGKTLSILKTFGSEEAEHVAALHKVATSLGTPATKPMGKFPLKSATSVAKLAGAVENLGAAAYLGQAGAIQSKEILAAALAIHSIEARHAATLNLVLKLSPTPEGAFAKPMTMAEVLKVVKPFIA
ncbi:MAG TPA: ferritin-like domain-containing protein [Solirubrobacteraceae bacterium]|nr:ferritin-like domain-containing protein [Solirubrobacteraceae bacterium]